MSHHFQQSYSQLALKCGQTESTLFDARVIILSTFLAHGGVSLQKAKSDVLMRQVFLLPGEDGFWVAESPSLPGCLSQGKTKRDSLSNIREAILGYIEALEEDHLPVPPEKFEAVTVIV